MYFKLIYQVHCHHSNLVSKSQHILDQILLCILTTNFIEGVF